MAWQPGVGEPPAPDRARTVAELGDCLRALQAWAGLSVRDIHRRVARDRRARGVPELPALDTVHRCLKPGRTRLDAELVTDIARVLLGDDARAAQWRHAHRAVSGHVVNAALVSVHAGLPDEHPAFVGRRAAVARLVEAGAPVAVVEGMAGVGKTTLAVHAAHRLVRHGRFAELQLWVNLRGHDPDRPPADPAAVLAAMLGRLGCPSHRLRGLDLAGRTALLRELLARRDALVLLDNAADEDQVGPLVAGGRCLTLVTSRRQLHGLDGLGATHLRLDPFEPGEAYELLTGVVGADRVRGERAAATGIAEAVGHLPLALALVAGRIVATPDWTLRDHLDRLVERRTKLALDESVAVAIDSSFAGLPPARQRLLRLLATQPGRDIDSHAAAALAGTDLPATRGELDALVGEHLLSRQTPDRFVLHDLIRVFAADRACDLDAPQAREAALTRLLEYYRFVTYAAARLYEPHYMWDMELASPATPVPAFADRTAAAAWLEAEWPNLIACALRCTGPDRARYASDLAALLHHFLYMTGRPQEAELLDRHASQVARGVDAARALARLGSVCSWLGRLTEARHHYLRALAVLEVENPELAARCLANYAILCGRLGRFTEAIDCHERAMAVMRERGEHVLAAQQLGSLGHLHCLTGRQASGTLLCRQALEAARSAADRIGEADALCNLGFAAAMAGDSREALDRFGQALGIFRELGDRAGRTAALNGCGFALTGLGEFDEALRRHRQAMETAREIGDSEGEAEALVGSGRALHRLGRPAQARPRLRGALTVSEQTGNPWLQARAHDALAAVLAAEGDTERARGHWQRALELHRAMGTTDADRITAELSGV